MPCRTATARTPFGSETPPSPWTTALSVPLVAERDAATASNPSVGGLAVAVVPGGSWLTAELPLPSTASIQT